MSNVERNENLIHNCISSRGFEENFFFRFLIFVFIFTARSQSSLSHHSSAPHASTATKELDDLMASLSDFKVSPQSCK